MLTKLYFILRLGIILGSKMFINFKKYDWPECIKRLSVEVANVYKQKKHIDHSSSNSKPANNDHVAPTETKEKDDDKKNESHQQENANNQADSAIYGARFQTNLSKGKVKKVLSWSEVDTEKWISEKNFSAHLIENLKPNVNGKILFQMYTMLRNTPEFFYTALRSDSNNKIILKDLAIFSHELGDLFEENEFFI